MNIAALKSLVMSEIDRHAPELIKLGKDIWREPELGYEEVQTAAKIEKVFERLNLPVTKPLALTGLRADLNLAEAGPTLAILGELDALYLPDHPEAAANGAVHACGHNMQIATLAGTAIGLAIPEVQAALAGKIAFMACPAEEGRLASLRPGVNLVAGKAEMIYNGDFDDIDLAMMTHANSTYSYAPTSNGLVMKKVVFHGTPGHAGRPWLGNNALSAARQALNALDAQRDLFAEKDLVRIHGIVKSGGTVVNIVPNYVELEYMVRAHNLAAIERASQIFDRSMRGAAVAFGLTVEIETRHGYMPLKTDLDMMKIHEQNMKKLYPDQEFITLPPRSSSTDMGDVSQIMPIIHPYSGNWSGTAHTFDFHWQDEYDSFVQPAKLLALDAIDLLADQAQKARQLIQTKPAMTREEYRAMIDKFNSLEKFDGSKLG